MIASYQETAARRGHPFPAAFEETAPRRARLEFFLRQDQHVVPCHNDLLAGNLLHDGARLLLLDWEYAGMGDARFDLANLFSNLELTEADRACFLEAWFSSPDKARAAQPGIDAMLIMSDLREAAWGFLQAALHTAPSSGPPSETDGFDYAAYGWQFLERAVRRKMPDLSPIER